MIKAAIIGANGYTGYELLRILAAHPGATVTEASSRQYAGQPVTGVFPSLSGFYDSMSFKAPEEIEAAGTDVVFCCLPHGASQSVVAGFLKKGVRVIDLSADFRIKDKATYEQWYGEHTESELLGSAVYGLPELYRSEIKEALLIANPGCYPTSAILGLAPLMKGSFAKADSIIIDSKSGVSGAGRGANLATSYTEVSESFRAYNVGAHRHTPEIDQELSALSGSELKTTFTPHLLPVSRGILSTIYATLTPEAPASVAELASLYRNFYAEEPFVRILGKGTLPDIKMVRSSNFIDIAIGTVSENGRVTILSAIDNITKGASGQAVQNMNIAFGLEERAGLETPPIQL